MKPLAVDLCCGLGGWTEGLLAEGWDVVGSARKAASARIAMIPLALSRHIAQTYRP